MEALLAGLERQGIVLAGPDSWTLTEPGRKVIYDKNFVQDALKADIEYAGKVQQAAGQKAPILQDAGGETVWRSTGEEPTQDQGDCSREPQGGNEGPPADCPCAKA